MAGDAIQRAVRFVAEDGIGHPALCDLGGLDHRQPRRALREIELMALAAGLAPQQIFRLGDAAIHPLGRAARRRLGCSGRGCRDDAARAHGCSGSLDFADGAGILRDVLAEAFHHELVDLLWRLVRHRIDEAGVELQRVAAHAVVLVVDGGHQLASGVGMQQRASESLAGCG